jgi:hypothetical protein
MRNRRSLAPLVLTIILVVPLLALCQAAQQARILIVNGQLGQVTVVQMNGRSYVDLETLARVANGSLSFSGNQITLTLPSSPNTPSTAAASTSASSAAASAPASAPTNPGFSKAFLKAGIEAMSLVREWHSALANAIQNGFPIAESWLSGYRIQAQAGLRLASVAASTDSDQSAAQLLNNEFENMKTLSSNYVAARQSLDYIAPDALANDALNQKIVNCGHSLAAMAASGQFVDDGSCQ